MLRPLLFAAGLAAAAAPLAAQGWNDSAATTLVARGVLRRVDDPARGLRDFRARAHGFVFFLAQLGHEGLSEPPRLVKSDQLELEVYWQTPGRSKQRIIGWRDRADLPTEIQYHRDHLGIVQNGFADRIRLGEGDEVRDVPHPLAPDGPALYDYALTDSLLIQLPGRTVRVHALGFRPRTFAAPRIVGTMYLDADGGELVRLEFSFTRAAYLDASLEDIAVVLENGLWDGRYWLPRRQEIEIRRRTTWLDVPARGIIRARWEIDGYAFDVGLPDGTFLGPEIVATPFARDSFPWPDRLEAAVATVLGPRPILRMEEVRAQVQALAGSRSLSGLRTGGLSIESLSELLHVNRVEGLTPGLGVLLRPGAGPFAARAWASVGFSDERPKGGLELRYELARGRLAVRAARTVADVADEPVISGVLNSVLAQELGDDFGDYVQLDVAELRGAYRGVRVRAGVQRTASLPVTAGPATGGYRPNPPLGSGTWGVAAIGLEAGSRGVVGRSVRGRADVEGGLQAGASYARLRGGGEAVVPAGPGRLTAGAWAGWGSADLPPHRLFVLGGRGTLVGEPFRAFGGRAAALARIGWQVDVPFPAIPLGAFASTGRQLMLEPYLAVGWVGEPVVGLPWGPSGGARPVVGVAVEVFHNLLRVDAGWAPRARAVRVTVDVRRALWPLL